MPSISRVRRTGRWDCSTKWMISSFSEAGYLMRRPPQPRSCFFFEQAVLQREVGHNLLQGTGLAPQRLDLVRRGGPGGVAGQALLSRFEELLRPAVVLGRGDALAPAQLGDAVLAVQALEHDGILVLGREMAPRRAPDIFDDGLCRMLRRPGCLLH